MKKPDKKIEKALGLGNVWKYYYRDSANLFKLEEQRQKREKEHENEEAKKAKAEK